MPADLRVARSPKPSSAAAGPYEPLTAGRLSRESVEVVERIHKQFLQAAESQLSELLQTPVKMALLESEQSTFSDVLARTPGDRVIALDLSPVPGSGFLSLSRPLMFGVLDILLATPENSAEDEGRNVTAIELHILSEFFDLLVKALADTWKESYPVTFRQLPTPEGQPDQRVAAAGSDAALALAANVKIAGLSADFRLSIPTCLARMADLQLKSAASHADSGPGNSETLERLADARLEVEAVLMGGSIRIRDLLNLTPGRILMTGNSSGSPFDCLVNGTHQFTGNMVSDNGRCGIRIDKPADCEAGAFACPD